MSDQKRYVAFVSYNHADRRWAKWVHHAVETYRVPSRLHRSAELAAISSSSTRLTPVFLDREELSTSSDLAGSVRVALEQSSYLIVVCSPPYKPANASTSAPASSNISAISTAFVGVFWRCPSTPFAAT